MSDSSKTVALQYFALLREQRKLSMESRQTTAATARELYAELQRKYDFKLSPADLKVAVNGEFTDFDQVIHDGDEIVFIPPVAGG